jgi:hypothetical protein
MAGVIDQECNGQAPSRHPPPGRGAALPETGYPAGGEIDATYVHQG